MAGKPNPYDGSIAKDPLSSLNVKQIDLHAGTIRYATKAETIAAAKDIVSRIQSGGTIYACGNGGSAEQANHLVAELVGGYLVRNRRPYRAQSLTSNSAVLTALANDYGWERVFSRQVEVCSSDDIVVVISTSGMSHNVLEAAMVAHHAGALVVAIGPPDKNSLLYKRADHVLRAWSHGTPGIQEDHLAIIHTLAGLIEHIMETGSCE